MRLCTKSTTQNFVTFVRSEEPKREGIVILATAEPCAEIPSRETYSEVGDVDGEEDIVISASQDQLGFVTS